MIVEIEEFYRKIADEIAISIPDDWTSSSCEVTFYSDSIEYYGIYTNVDGVLDSFSVSRELSKTFKELRRKFKEVGQPVWGQATFELLADGKFNMKWGYENCDVNGNTIYNSEEWLRRQEERRLRLNQQSR